MIGPAQLLGNAVARSTLPFGVLHMPTKISTLEAREYLEAWRSAQRAIALRFTGNGGVVTRFFCNGRIAELTNEGFVFTWGADGTSHFRVGSNVELSDDKDSLTYLYNFGDRLIVSAT